MDASLKEEWVQERITSVVGSQSDRRTEGKRARTVSTCAHHNHSATTFILTPPTLTCASPLRSAGIPVSPPGGDVGATPSRKRD